MFSASWLLCSVKYLKVYEWIYMVSAGPDGLQPKNNWLHSGRVPDLWFPPLGSYVFYLWIWGRWRLDSKFCSNIRRVKVLIKLRHWNKEVRTIGRRVFMEFDKAKCDAWAQARFVELQNKKTMITRGHVLLMLFILMKSAFPFYLPLPPDFMQK